MAVNKVIYNTAQGEEVLMDLTSDTVTPETLAEGVTAHDASGELIVGTKVFENLDPALNEQETKINELLAVLDSKGAENLNSILAVQEAKINELLAILDSKLNG